MQDKCTNYEVLLKNTLTRTEKTRFLWPELAYHYDCDLKIYVKIFLKYASLRGSFDKFWRYVLLTLIRWIAIYLMDSVIHPLNN